VRRKKRERRSEQRDEEQEASGEGKRLRRDRDRQRETDRESKWNLIYGSLIYPSLPTVELGNRSWPLDGMTC
jgi:hypothetical protein